MRLVLIGDIHAYRLAVPPWHLAGKALFGQANLWWRRRKKFDLSLLPAVVERAVGLRPDLVLLSGDLTTTSYGGEFGDVAAALGPLLALAPAVAVPGNHDRYTILSMLRGSFERALPGIVPGEFPFLRPIQEIVHARGEGRPSAAFRRLQAAAKQESAPRADDASSQAQIRSRRAGTESEIPAGRWHLLALHSALPTPTSRGRVGRRQLAAAAAGLRSLSPADGLLVLCHYSLGKPPAFKPSPWHHLLADAAGLMAMLADFPGRVVYLHGHVHRPWVWLRPEAALKRVVDVNAGAPCCVGPGFPCGQGFWEIELPVAVDAPIQFLHHQPTPGITPAPGPLNWQIEPTIVPWQV